MWRTSATGLRRRPTSCARTANRGALMSIYKNGKASTLQIVQGVKGIVQQARAVAAAGTEDHAAVRSVVVRARFDLRRVARRPDRRGADRRA